MKKLALLLVLVVALIPSVASAAVTWTDAQGTRWVPLTAEDSPPSVHLVDSTGNELRGTWRQLAPRDTLEFALRGSGDLRVETRAMVARGDDSRRYHLGVETSAATVRRLVRRSSGAESFTARTGNLPGTRVRLTRRDRWTTPIEAGSDRVRVWLREPDGDPVYVRVLARGEIQIATHERVFEPEVKYNATAGLFGGGFTSNAFLAPSDSSTSVAKFRWPAEAAVGLWRDQTRHFGFGIGYKFDGLIYGNDILNEYRHALQAEQRWTDLGSKKLDFRFEQRLRYKDDTFVTRSYDEEVNTFADLTHPDRFDWRDVRLRASLRRSVRQGIGWGASASFARRDYVEDFASDPTTYALDQNRTEADLWLEWRGDRKLRGQLTVGLQDRNYDEKFARLADGTQVTSEPTHLMYWPVTLEFGQRPRVGWRWSANTGLTFVRDRFDGYWDRTTWQGGASATWVHRDKHSLGFRVQASSSSYDVARVGYSTTGAIRDKSSFGVRGRGIYKLGPHWDARAELGFENRDNNSRFFAYSRLTGMAGLVWSY